jgi:hypothetical protein
MRLVPLNTLIEADARRADIVEKDRVHTLERQRIVACAGGGSARQTLRTAPP